MIKELDFTVKFVPNFGEKKTKRNKHINFLILRIRTFILNSIKFYSLNILSINQSY